VVSKEKIIIEQAAGLLWCFRCVALFIRLKHYSTKNLLHNIPSLKLRGNGNI